MALATPMTRSANLIAPYGGKLVNLLVADDLVNDKLISNKKQALKEYATHLPSLQLSMRAICDLELLAVGAFSPLDRFMGKRDYQCVLNESRLANGSVFPIPVTLSVEPMLELRLGQDIALRDLRNNLLAVMTVEEIYEWNMEYEASRVYGSVDLRHPRIAEMHRLGKLNISGPLRVLQLPAHHDFGELRLTPAETRARLEQLGHANVVAFQTRNPLQRAHEEVTRRAVQAVDGSLLLHPIIGMGKNTDAEHYLRVHSYQAMSERFYDRDRVMVGLLPLARRMAGPREAIWHMIIRRNYGANHLIIGRDHAGPVSKSSGKPFYGPYDAQEIAELYSGELGMKVVPFRSESTFNSQSHALKENVYIGNHSPYEPGFLRE